MMGKAVIIGPTPLEQPLEYSVDQVSGFVYTRTWIGPRFAVERVRLIEQKFAESMRVTAKGAVYTLVGRYIQTPNGGEVPTETQELETDQIEQDIFLNASFQDLIAKEQMIVRTVFETQKDEKVHVPNMTPPDYETILPFLDPYSAGVYRIQGVVDPTRWVLAIAAYDLLIRGTTSFQNYAFVLNRTRTASRRYSGKINLTNIGKVCSTEDLVKYTKNGLLFNTPDLTLTGPETSKNLFAGWRLRVCRVSDTSNGSRQMVEQWVLGKHSLDLYSTYVP